MNKLNESYEQYLFENAKLLQFDIRIGSLVDKEDGKKEFNPEQTIKVSGDSIDEFIDNLKRAVVEKTGAPLSDSSEQSLRSKLFHEIQKLFMRTRIEKLMSV